MKRYRFYKYGFFALLVVLALVCYASWDMLVLKVLVTRGYIFTDALDTLYAETISKDSADISYARDFDAMVSAVVTERLRRINSDRYTYLYTPTEYKLTKAIEKSDAKTASAKEITPSTAYLYLPNISSGTKDFVMENKAFLRGYKNLVIDLRGNYGGMLVDFYAISELFLPKGKIIGHELTRIPILSRTIVSKNEPYFHFERIVILQDENTASAAEGLILSLRQNLDNVSTLGTTTFGKGIGQVTIPQTRGYALKATVLLVSGPDNVSIHNKGIAPDVVYGEDGDENKNGDIVQRALEMVERKNNTTDIHGLPRI